MSPSVKASRFWVRARDPSPYGTLLFWLLLLSKLSSLFTCLRCLNFHRINCIYYMTVKSSNSDYKRTIFSTLILRRVYEIRVSKWSYVQFAIGIVKIIITGLNVIIIIVIVIIIIIITLEISMSVVGREDRSYYERLNWIMSKLLLKADYHALMIYSAWGIIL
jgi:hypothetical protein